MRPDSSHDAARFAQVMALFEEVCELDEAERCRRLAKVDESVRVEVEELLARDEGNPLEAAVAREAAELLDEQESAESLAPEALLAQLADHRPDSVRYRVQAELARGGMGRILEAWDPDLRRTLALKVMHDGDDASPSDLRLARFLEEAQITGQLDHPGIVAVHELGIDADGHVFFSMPLIRGLDLGDVFDAAREERDGWNTTRALGVLLRACEAMAYAHSKGVIHRDLKPSNVRVGRFGEVYVMDWGIARIQGRPDRHGLKAAHPTTRTLSTDRRDAQDSTAPLVTMDGKVIGTPHYMSLEQAAGRVEDIGPHSDVYAIGAMLYELLAGRRPYVAPGHSMSAYTVLAAVLDRPPTPLRLVDKTIPGELIAICEKAMARDISSRYADTLELANDLRAFLEQRVVSAYRTGPIAELSKWVRRNRATAASVAATVLLSLTLLSALWLRERKHADDAIEASRSIALAEASARSELAHNQRLLDIRELSRLRATAAELWPAWPETIPSYQQWLADAHDIAARRGEHQAFFSSLSDAGTNTNEPSRGEVTRTRWDADILQTFLADLDSFVDPAPDGNNIAAIQQRLVSAETLRARTVDALEDAWDIAAEDVFLVDAYDGLELEPQLGLVPLGPDPETGFLECAVDGSGTIPTRDDDERLVLVEESAIVLVLLPGGAFHLGAQTQRPNEEQYQPNAAAATPMRELTLDPFFLGKYEVTQGQYLRLVGDRPSFHPLPDRRVTVLGETPWKLLPVEQVHRFDALACARRVGLTLPTEAQLEYAIRGGTRSRWCTGNDPDSIRAEDAGNLWDRSGAAANPENDWGSPVPWDDGAAGPAPVGSYRANDFGLHDVLGNVNEWCLEDYGDYNLPTDAGTGRRQVPSQQPATGVYRGGSFAGGADSAQSAFRPFDRADTRHFSLGFRAARPITPAVSHDR